MQIADELRPQSWEMPPGYRLFEKAAAVVARDFWGETQFWMMAPVQMPCIAEPVLWIKRHDVQSDAGFVVHGAEHLGHTLFAPGQNPKVLDWVFSQGNYQRQFILNAQGELRREGEAAHQALLVDCVGNGSWSLGAIRAHRHDSSRFSWNALMTPAAFRKLSARDVWRIIGELLADPQSDAAFARRFALMSEEERHLLIFGRPQIDKAQLTSLLHALLVSSVRWDKDALAGALFFSLRADGEYTLYFRSEEKGRRDPLPDQVHENVKRVRARFLSSDNSRNEELLKYGCASSWVNATENIAEITISNPSAHEQLEAKLRWRDWLASVEDSPR